MVLIQEDLQDVDLFMLHNVIGAAPALFVYVNSMYYVEDHPLRVARPGDKIAMIGHRFTADTTTGEVRYVNRSSFTQVGNHGMKMRIGGTTDSFTHDSKTMMHYMSLVAPHATAQMSELQE